MCNCGNTTTNTICTTCTPNDCACPIKDLSTDCIQYTGDDLPCTEIKNGTLLTETIGQLDTYLCDLSTQLSNSFSLISVGAGTRVYRGVDGIGRKEIRSITSVNDILRIELSTDDKEIEIGIDNAELGTFVRDNQITYTAGSGLNLTGTIFSNAAPDQVVSVVGEGATVVTGTYPNFTVASTDTTYTAGSGITLTGTVFSNNAPDQVVTLTGAGTTVVTGTYPNFTVTSTSTSADGSETKINSGSNITVTGTGTIANPYIVNGLLPPFEKVDEGNGPGYIIRGRDATFYGNIGSDAIDFSYSGTVSSIFGATGESSFAQGYDMIVSGFGAVGFGGYLTVGGIHDFSTGINNTTAGYTNFVTGVGHNITSMGTTVIGQASNIYSQQIADYNTTDTKPLFIIGNGTIADATDAPTYQPYDVMSRSDAFIVRMNGVAALPSVTNALITAESTGKAVVTKEYLNLQKIITYPADFTGTDYIITSADMGYSIIIVNGATAVNITVPTGLIAKMQVGFIQDGTGDVTIIPSGTTINTAVTGANKIKGQYDQVFLEQGLTTSVYYLLGNTKV